MENDMNNGAPSQEGAGTDNASESTMEAAFEQLNNPTETNEPSHEQNNDSDGENATEESAADTQNESQENEDAAEQSQTSQERSIYAKARRNAEAKAKKQMEKQWETQKKAFQDKAIADMGILDPFTGKILQTVEEHKAYQQRLHQQKADNVMKKAGISENELKDLVLSSPEVVEARRLLNEAKERETQTKRQQEQAVIQDEITQIGKFDPNVKSIKEFMQLDRYDDIYDKVMKGYSLLDAYKIVYYDQISQKREAMARQESLAGASSKGHMGTTSSSGKAPKTIPSDIRRAYLQFGFQESEIEKEYQKVYK